LIRFLEQAGVSVVMVGDVDQDIYGFRRAVPSEAEALAGLVAEGKALDGNYRSTPAICKLVDSLRFGDSTDLALGKYAHETRPVLVLKSNGPRGMAAKIAAEARKHSFESDQLVVLAHKGSDARQYAGAGNPVRTASSRIERLAQAMAVIQNSQAAPHTRAQTMALFESTLRECGGDELAALPDDDFFELCGLTQRQFRAGALRLAWHAAPYEAAPRAFQEAVAERALAAAPTSS
jgi:ATP-dependent exoDNAse (exonuclease V) beta subunit